MSKLPRIITPFIRHTVAAAVFMAFMLVVPATGLSQTIATVESEWPGVRADIMYLKRLDGDVLELRFMLINQSDDNINIGDLFRYRSDLRTLDLIDVAGRKLYRPIQGGGRALSSTFRVSQDLVVPAGESRMLWARFPAPPPKATEMTLIMPNFLPADGVPISD